MEHAVECYNINKHHYSFINSLLQKIYYNFNNFVKSILNKIFPTNNIVDKLFVNKNNSKLIQYILSTYFFKVFDSVLVETCRNHKVWGNYTI